MSDHERANEVPLEDLRLDAQQHYRELSDQGHVWRSDIPQAIDFYFEAKKIERAALAMSRPAPMYCQNLAKEFAALHSIDNPESDIYAFSDFVQTHLASSVEGAGEAKPVAWGIFEEERFIYGARQRDTLAADGYLRDHSTYSCHALYLCPAAMRTQP